MTTLFTVLFGVFAGCALVLLSLSVFIKNIIGKVLGYISIPISALSFFFASAAFRRLDVSLLVVMSILLCYLLISLLGIALDKKREESGHDV